ncbi:MAG: hypothetical protein MUC79_04525 [Thiobacillaceae bacterium]|jgi:hypothetical protein|nr:hypothetical protein [Thiobacillaceae bacterium]
MKTLIVLLLACCLGVAQAHADTEVIPLRHRSADEVIPALRPHLEPGASLSAFANQLIVSASPDNLARIMEILAAIDRPPRQLVITLRLADSAEAQDRGAALSARIGDDRARITLPASPAPPGAEVEMRDGRDVLRGRTWSTRELRDERASQQVRVVEGGSAYLQAGVSVPIALREVIPTPGGVVWSDSVVYRDLGTGFTARPTLAGDRVTLEISPWRETPLGDPRGVARVQRLSTTVSGRLGEWIPLGGSDLADQGDRRALVAASTRDLRRQGHILLRVDEVEPADAAR